MLLKIFIGYWLVKENQHVRKQSMAANTAYKQSSQKQIIYPSRVYVSSTSKTSNTRYGYNWLSLVPDLHNPGVSRVNINQVLRWNNRRKWYRWLVYHETGINDLLRCTITPGTNLVFHTTKSKPQKRNNSKWRFLQHIYTCIYLCVFFYFYFFVRV